MVNRRHKIILLTIFSLIFLIANITHANKLNVAYGGVFTAGDEKNYPNYMKMKAKFNINKEIANILRKLNDTGKLNFNLLLETDAEELKFDASSPCTFAIVITRDDCITEKFTTNVTGVSSKVLDLLVSELTTKKSTNDVVVYKNVINIGISAIFYQTDEIKANGQIENRHNIVFSIPITGYIFNLEGSKQLSEEALLTHFRTALLKIIEEKLPARLAKIALGKMEGNIIESRDDTIKVNIGLQNGLIEKQFVSLYEGNKKIGSGQVIDLKKKESIVKLQDKNIKITPNTKVVAVNIRGASEESYQITGFQISSKKAKELFKQEEIGPQLSQWLTDFLFYNGGKVMLPTTVGSDWITVSTENAFMILVKDGISYSFQLSKPKYEITLDFTGLADKVSEANKINTKKIYKVWIKLKIDKKKYEKEFDFADAKIIVNDIESYSKDPFLKINSVLVNNFEAAYSATNYLIKCGHKKIAIVKGPDEYISAYDRFRGFLEALKEAHLHIPEEYIEMGNLEYDGGYEAALRMIKKINKKNFPTAIFCVNDFTAIGVKDAFEKNGFLIPEDISIVGFDNVELAQQVVPALTTVDVPKEELGRLAVRRLNDLIYGKDSSKICLTVFARLIERESVKVLKK
ncbi:MAG: substrate-binding domain-containing protein [Endomicrobia bacterium]|nr:substrate-binding domain-containing protein [Endomicrobiia bacterium]